MGRDRKIQKDTREVQEVSINRARDGGSEKMLPEQA